MSAESTYPHPWAFRAFAAAAFTGAFSLPAGRAMLALSTVLLVVGMFRRRQRPAFPPVVWWALAYVAITIVVTMFGTNPHRGVPKLTKLIWFAGIPVGALLVTSSERLRHVVKAYALGAGVLAVKIGIQHPWKAQLQVDEGRLASFSQALVHAGSMTDGQRLMVGGLLALGLVLATRGTARRQCERWAGLLVVIGIGLLVNLKRGSWFCAASVSGVFLAVRAGWRYALALVLVLVSLLALPTVRTRLAALRHELDMPGGRVTMWTKIAPGLIHDHPWGIGYRALTNKTMRWYAPEMERRRDHLHSNPIQILVESGWLGLAAYLMWMACGLRDAYRCQRRFSADPVLSSVSLGLLFALVALLANGLVEYNMGDGEIVLAYGVILGTCAGMRGGGACARQDTAAAASGPA
ncbi:MAG: O-antigen ligase family protein [Lentisphaerae bacterium]|nr:O-antigen ligase family protein [Lentisphaerota bacterium]